MAKLCYAPGGRTKAELYDVCPICLEYLLDGEWARLESHLGQKHGLTQIEASTLMDRWSE